MVLELSNWEHKGKTNIFSGTLFYIFLNLSLIIFTAQSFSLLMVRHILQ